GRRHLVSPRVVCEDLLELLHGLLERLGCLVALRRIAESARQREVRLADPVLGAAGQLVIGVAPQELAKARDRQRVAALTEVDVRRVIDARGLQRGSRGALGCYGNGARGRGSRRRRGGGSRRSR